MKGAVFALAVVVVLGCAPITHAALTYDGGDLVYDKEQNITWYDSALPPMNWSSATFWAADQSVGGTTAGDWSFPRASGASWGSTTEAETGHLYWDEPADSRGRPHDDRDHFAPNWFWTGTEHGPNWFWTVTEYAPHWDGAREFGDGGFWNKSDRDDWYHFHARHYRHDEGPTTPMPTAALLFGPCFIGLAAIRRRFKK